MKFKFQKILVLFIISFIMFAIIFGASYSYFAAQGVGSGDDRQVITTTGKIELIYSDGSSYLTTTGDWEPGDYLTKTFTIRNNSSATAYYRLYMNDIVNTFVMQKKDDEGKVVENAPYELIYTLKKNDTVVINEESNTPVLTNSGLIYGSEGLGIEIDKDSSDTYELTIKFVDTGENQNYNQAKIFRTKISIEEPNDLYYMFTNMVETRDDVAYDDYGNIRFIGKNANNYISFNDEDWRIIGLFKDIEEVKEDNSVEKHYMLKIIRNNSIGNMKWASNGQNDWTNSDLMTKLNEDYLNNEGTYTSNSKIKSLVSVLDYISKVRWNIGGYNSVSAKAKDLYLKERSNVGSGSNSSVTTWDGRVALMYPSDYGYSVNGEVVLNNDTGEKTSCLNATMNTWRNNGCRDTSWLFYSNVNQWLLTPWSTNSIHVFYIYNAGELNYSVYPNPNDISVRPTLYLKHNIKLTGTGEQGANIFRILST